MRILFAACALLIAAGGTVATAAERQTDEQRLAKMLEGLTPGKPIDCIRQGPTIQSSNFEGAIVYRDGAQRYLNRFENGCPGLNRDNIIITHTYSGLLCRGDIARIVENFAPVERGSCVFGQFTPYTRAK